MLRKFPPLSLSFFLKKLISNKNLSKIDRMMLIGNLEIFKLELSIDSVDLADMIKSYSNIEKPKNVATIKEEVRNSISHIVSPLYSKLSNYA